MNSTAKHQAQQHLLPKQGGARIGSVYNELDFGKRNYIIKMRQGLGAENSKNIIFDDGSLNFKYFNVKKGHYWSRDENDLLIKGVLEHGATAFKKIRESKVIGENWSETEIRLRICRLLKCYNLKEYEGHKFTSKEEILECAKRNKEEAIKAKKICGGILYNPVHEADDGIINSMFNQKKAATTVIGAK